MSRSGKRRTGGFAVFWMAFALLVFSLVVLVLAVVDAVKQNRKRAEPPPIYTEEVIMPEDQTGHSFDEENEEQVPAHLREGLDPEST